MAGATPAFKNLAATVAREGFGGGDVHRVLYNIFLALYYLCNNIDDDAGTIDSDYASKISTPMVSAGIGSELPLGAVDSTVSKFYTPGKINWNGIRNSDLYTVFYNLAIAIHALCDQLDGDNGSALGTDYRSKISTPLAACLSAVLPAPSEGLISGTYFYGLESYIDKGAYVQGDLYKCCYDFYIAIVRICTILDAGAGTLPATLLANVGTPLNTAVGKFIQAPAGPTTTGS